MKFTKMQGIGNDYIYFDCTEQQIENPNALAIKLSDRHFGVGGDGIILIMKSDVADFRMRMFNADGSEGKMCGNGTRCIGKFVYDKGLTNKEEITLETLSGIKHLKFTIEDGKVSAVSVDMGKAILEPKQIPVAIDEEKVIDYDYVVDGQNYKINCVSMGNPHCVIFTETDVDTLMLDVIGPKFEKNEVFPESVNTEFVNIIDSNTLKMRVWERGSGETLACGTGACAVVCAAVENGICKRDSLVTVKLLGGDLKIVYKSDGTVNMTGPAEFVFEGEC